jgi:hypothetical protein
MFDCIFFTQNNDPAPPAQELLTNQRSILANGQILTQHFERLGAG